MIGMREDPAKKFFHPSVTDRDRAMFEAGIALGAIYHQFTGLPVAKSREVLDAVKRVIEEAMGIQPFRERVEVHFNLEAVKGELKTPYDYSTLKGEMLDVKVQVRYGCVRVKARMRFVPELGFNLMYVEDVESLEAQQG